MPHNPINTLSYELYEYIGSKNIAKIKTLNYLMQKLTINLYKKCQNIGIFFEIISAKRSFEEQKYLYEQYNKTYKNIKIEKPGNSVHEKGMAIDIKIGESHACNTYYEEVAKIWKELNKNNFWGGDNINNEYWHFSIQKGTNKNG